MRRWDTSRSSGPVVSDGTLRPGVDVYLLPAVVGGGLGDIDEVLCAGRHLARAGFSLTVFRREGRPLPDGVDGRWDWPLHRRTRSVVRQAEQALTVTPAWGVTAAPPREGPLGGPGAWSVEAAEIERTYGPERTVHVSLEEFARTLTSREESVERLREGGVRSTDLRARLARAEAAGEVEVQRRAFRRFRAFDVPNVLGVFAGFRYDRAFAREFPEAVQTGPLWPARARAPLRSPRQGRRAWVWYASPASAQAIAPGVLAGLRSSAASPSLFVRTPRPWSQVPAGRLVRVVSGPLREPTWQRRLEQAALRIVTGSRTLLEALELGGPFLYFNGVFGRGPARRRHRPEKIVELLAVVRNAGWPTDLCGDLADFARGRRVQEVTARAADGEGGWRRFPSWPRPSGFAAGFEDAGPLLVRFARELAGGGFSSAELVDRFRARSHP